MSKSNALLFLAELCRILDLEYNEDAAIEIFNEAGGKSTDQLDYCSLIKLIESWSTHEHVDLSQSLQSNLQKEKKLQEEIKQQQLQPILKRPQIALRVEKQNVQINQDLVCCK